MAALTALGRERLGDRAAEHVDDRGVTTVSGRSLLVPDEDGIPEDVHGTLTDLYGRPATIDRGEIAYWLIDGADVEED